MSQPFFFFLEPFDFFVFFADVFDLADFLLGLALRDADRVLPPVFAPFSPAAPLGGVTYSTLVP
jgi:hypothetical protein